MGEENLATGLKEKDKVREKERESTGKEKRRHPKLKKFFIILLVLAIITAVAYVVFTKLDIGSMLALNFGKEDNEPEIITVSELEKIINVSELSTYTAVYNGIAQIMNEDKPDQIDYYVSYEAKVKAGIDFSKVKIDVDNEAKEIHFSIPEIHITDINVDIGSLDYIFLNKKANTSTVSKTAYAACEKDVREESKAQEEIFDLSKENAEHVLTALISPIIELQGIDYELVID